MGRAYNTLKASDVTVTPIKLKYSASYPSSSLSSSGITISSAINGPMSPTGSYPSSFLLYRSVRSMFYMQYISGSLLGSGSGFEYYPQSTAASGTFDEDHRYFPTESNAQVTVLSIPRILYGENIAKTSFRMAYTASYNLVDDGNGNIIDTSASNAQIGNLIYPMGLAIITSKTYQNVTNYPFTMSFQAESTIFQNEIRCHINENEFNYSTNPSTVISSSLGTLYNNVTGSDFNPYATTIGLYNSQNELLVVGKFGTPYPIPRHTDVTFTVKYDT